MKRDGEQLDLFATSEKEIFQDIRKRKREGRLMSPKHDEFLREHFAPYGTTPMEQAVKELEKGNEE